MMRNKRIADAITAAQNHIETSTYTGSWWYALGTVQAALNQKEQARESFKKALLLQDNRMLFTILPGKRWQSFPPACSKPKY